MNLHLPITASASPTRMRRKIVLLQTQAEAAGAQEISRLLAQRLGERGHDVHQMFLFRRTDAFDGDPRVVMCAPERASDPIALARLLLTLYRELRRLKPDVVICFQHFGNLIGAPAARLAGVRRVIANHNGAQDLLQPWIVRLDWLVGMLGVYSRIVVNSESTAREYASYPARYRRQIVRVDHGFGTKSSLLTKEEARASFALADSPVLLGSVARLAPKKHLDAAIRLLPGEPTWHLALAGQGPAQPDLARLAAELGCAERVHFTGELSSARIGDFLAALDVFVFPSLTETFGLAAVEAAQFGVPVVANDLPIFDEVLQDDGQSCALLVRAADTAALRGSGPPCSDGTGPRPAAVRARTEARCPLSPLGDGRCLRKSSRLTAISLGRGDEDADER